MSTLVDKLNNHLQTLSKIIIDNKLQTESYMSLQKTLEAISFYIKKYNLELSVDCTITSTECDVCYHPIKQKNEKNKITFQCNHHCCSNDCLKNHVMHSNRYLTDYQETKCPKCNKYIMPNIIENAYGGKDEFEIFLQKYEDERAARFDCGICYTKTRVDEGITFNCDHRFCQACVKDFANAMIDQGSVSEKELACADCGNPISPVILKFILTPTYFERFIKFRNREYIPENEEGAIVFYKCTGNDCEWFVVCDEAIEIVTCPSCRIKNCPKCRDLPHIGLTCEQNEKRKEDERLERLRKQKEEEKAVKDKEDEDEFIEAAKKLGFKTCPHCKSMCERISGCNFMRCYSKSCAGKKNFCLLCEKAITDAQHYSHYKAQGPYGKICNALDGTPE
ncbi:hypothetical protein SteCoe_33506 [Stentor coeruleus]|uniref:RBR-type E3 ubiquitin transferase n=1 Tax=Stentor coeruleus TaxID=5963 RepID=A0A1R2AWT0_9CILI|nr:hypothetical protein SteCoe_33506 [Stentor coeruleus]